MHKSFARAIALAVAAFAIGAVPALAAPPETQNPAGHMRGVVFAHNQAKNRPGSNNNLSWHGGPVQHASQVYAIYWSPSNFSGVAGFSAGYDTTIDQYFTDLTHDITGQSTETTGNVYFSDTQYNDTGTNARNYYPVSFANAVYDSTPAAAGTSCSDRYTPAGCVTDQQIESEISTVISQNSLPTGMGTEYFVFTPKGLGSCDGSSCSFSYWCAYHSNFQATSGGPQILYANMPYASTVSGACGSGQSPNGPSGSGPADADSTINLTSHEHNETVTDPLGTGWWDRSGYEDGDKCAWTFGSTSGSTSFGAYNQTINADHYYLQREWSNAAASGSGGCVLTGT
jgi:hypothetical protein